MNRTVHGGRETGVSRRRKVRKPWVLERSARDVWDSLTRSDAITPNKSL